MNAADPLAGLRPLHLPEAVGWWPPAPGWWLLLGLLLATAGLLSWLLWRRWRRHAYRRQALRELEQLLVSGRLAASPAPTLLGINVLLKRVALVAFPGAAVARLCGEDWLGFLDQGIEDSAFSTGPGRALVEHAYRADCHADLAAVGQLCRSWIQAQR